MTCSGMEKSIPSNSHKVAVFCPRLKKTSNPAKFCQLWVFWISHPRKKIKPFKPNDRVKLKEKMLDERASGEDIYHARLVATLAFALSCCVSIWSKGQKPMLSEEEKQQSYSLGALFCVCYSALAREALTTRKPLWKIRPKHHYWVHLLDYMYKSSLNPMSTSNFLDEDMMKAMRGVAKACHPKTVKHAWAKRYLLKKVIAWNNGGEKEWSSISSRFAVFKMPAAEIFFRT